MWATISIFVCSFTCMTSLMSRYNLINQNFKTSLYCIVLYCIVLYCMTLFYVGNNVHLHQITNIESESNRTNLNRLKPHNLTYSRTVHIIRPPNPPKSNISHPTICKRTFTTKESKIHYLHRKLCGRTAWTIPKRTPPNFALDTK